MVEVVSPVPDKAVRLLASTLSRTIARNSDFGRSVIRVKNGRTVLLTLSIFVCALALTELSLYHSFVVNLAIAVRTSLTLNWSLMLTFESATTY